MRTVLAAQAAAIDEDDLCLKGPTAVEQDAARGNRFWRSRNHLQQTDDDATSIVGGEIEDYLCNLYKRILPTEHTQRQCLYAWWRDQSAYNDQKYRQKDEGAFDARIQRIVATSLKKKRKRGWMPPEDASFGEPTTSSATLAIEPLLLLLQRAGVNPEDLVYILSWESMHRRPPMLML